jgi:hypothetical protein
VRTAAKSPAFLWPLCVTVVSLATAIPASSSPRTLPRTRVACRSDDTYALDIGRWMAADTMLGGEKVRARHGIAPWPVDSVRIVTDSALCYRVDSLIERYRDSAAHPVLDSLPRPASRTLSLVRIGPSIFYVDPAISNENGMLWFLADTASGSVEFGLSTP